MVPFVISTAIQLMFNPTTAEGFVILACCCCSGLVLVGISSCSWFVLIQTVCSLVSFSNPKTKRRENDPPVLVSLWHTVVNSGTIKSQEPLLHEISTTFLEKAVVFELSSFFGWLPYLHKCSYLPGLFDFKELSVIFWPLCDPNKRELKS